MPARAGGHSALSRLVAVTVEQFAQEFWGRAPLVTPASALPSRFDDLFSNDAVDELVSRRGLRAPFLRVAKNGTTLAERAFTAPGGVGATIGDQLSDDKLLRLFADGATIVLQGLHRTWEPVTRFTQDLAAELGHPVQVNAYVTPTQSIGFSDHYDVHDVFVLQVAGEKRWRIRPPVLDSPLRDQPWADRRTDVEAAALQEPLLEVTLRPGDCLYLPRGYLHAATALGDVSTHLTMGVHPWTRRHLADEMLAVALRRASEDEQVRASLPLGVRLDDPDNLEPDLEVIRAAVLRAVQEVDAEDLVDALAARGRSSQRASAVAPVATVRAATHLEPDAVLVLRRHLAARLKTSEDDPVQLLSRAGDLRVADGDLDAVRVLLEDGFGSVADLGADLARRLLLSGIVTLDER